MNLSDVFNEAADDLERDGWFGADPGDGIGWPSPTCVANAAFRVARRHGVELWQPAQDALVAHLGFDALHSVWAWNDAPERTKAEVVEVLRAAAVVEAARECAAVEVVGWRGTYPNIAAAYVADAPALVGASA